MIEVIETYFGELLLKLITVSLPLTVIAFTIGLILALFIAIMRMSSNKVLKAISGFYISLVRGTPLLVQLFIIFYGLPTIGIVIDPYPSAVIGFSINISAYAAESIRGSILSIPNGQWEAAKSLGMNFPQTMRRIIIPQATRVAIPPLSNTLISLVKDTSLASIVLVAEMFRRAQEVAAVRPGIILQVYLLVALLYWLIVIGLTSLQNRYEKYLNRYIKGASS
ncbi:amino acid ABC transporter permease [Haloplasma contractile]|uniref:Cystine transport system permease protein n=1 Tax=Haloplasma contractile SSD-17B TaxID=1033810 RepID=U2FDX3_9MOLU|nr:amino acid ABC transporter permease [Haloplasma contractile]ERJ11180.1 Cystine transport system permease protein [Haloplasma contractile SSD-17B]